jgi:hypothetical protein
MRRVVGYAFDSHPGSVGSCELRRNDDMGSSIVLTLGGQELVLMTSWRDQWGVFIEMGGICVAQEDQTRSCIDGLIRCLQAFREQNECGTTDATIVADVASVHDAQIAQPTAAHDDTAANGQPSSMRLDTIARITALRDEADALEHRPPPGVSAVDTRAMVSSKQAAATRLETKAGITTQAECGTEPVAKPCCTMHIENHDVHRTYHLCDRPAYSWVMDLGITLYLCKMHHHHAAKRRAHLGLPPPEML